MSASNSSSFSILWQLTLIETVKYIFNEWKQSMSAQFAKCVCVQDLALSATTHCTVIFLMTNRNGPKRLKDGRGRPRNGPGRPLQKRSRWFYVSFDQNINLLSEVYGWFKWTLKWFWDHWSTSSLQLNMVKRRTIVFYFVLGKAICVYRTWYCVQLLCWQNFHFSSVL